MQRSRLVIFCATLLLCFFAVAGAAEWKEYKPEGSRCSLSLPKAPALSAKNVDTDSGPIEMHQVLADFGEYAYLMTYNDYPLSLINEKGSEKILADVVSGSVGDGELITKRDITFGLYPGREYVCKKQGLYLKARVYLIKHRLYQMIAAYPPAQADVLSTDIETFLSSFRLIASE